MFVVTLVCLLLAILVSRSHALSLGGIPCTRHNLSRNNIACRVKSMRLHAELKKSKDLPMINEEITSPVVRLLLPKDGESLGEDEMIGIVPIERALQEARIRELDLVLINEKSDPPVCKVIDFGKYKYTIEKRKKDNLKKQNKVETKEIKMSASIEQHDFDVRSRALQKFIADGYRVSVVSKNSLNTLFFLNGNCCCR
jgi:translation initiation factor IF-3